MILITKLTKTLQDRNRKVTIFDNFNLKIAKGEIIGIIGNNGIGKTTLLDIISGLKKPDKGEVLINNKKINQVKVGYVFQNYRQSLFPWMNIIDNISFPLKLKGILKKNRYIHTREFCRKYGFNIKFNEYPNKLSGGEYQMATVIRSLIDKPDLLLMDEPFSSLDYYNSMNMQNKILDIWETLKMNILLVSHRIEEAIFLSNRIIILGDSPVRVIDDFVNPLTYPRKPVLLSNSKSNMIRKRILLKLNMI